MHIIEQNDLRNKVINIQTACVGLIGGTGTGKTLFTTTWAEPKARKLLQLVVGESNSTLKERKIIYTDASWVKGSVVVAIKYNEKSFSTVDFLELNLKAIGEFIENNGKKCTVEGDMTQLYSILEKTILLNCKNPNKTNTKAIFDYLEDNEIEEFVTKLVGYLKYQQFLEKNAFTIYYEAKNKLNKDENVNSSNFSLGIKLGIEKVIDTYSVEDYQSIIKEINQKLKSKFLNLINIDNFTKDHYYFEIIDLENWSENEFVYNFFTNNNLKLNSKLSIESLCSEILIFVPIHEKLIPLIFDEGSKKRLTSKDNNLYFSILDTRGLFHKNLDYVYNLEYFKQLVYNLEYDALILTMPLFADANTNSLQDIYVDGLKNFKKKTPIVILNNKLDLLANSLSIPKVDDLFEEDNNGIVFEVDSVELQKEVDLRCESFKQRLLDNTAVQEDNLKLLPCSLEPSNLIPKEFMNKYGLKNILQVIISTLTDTLKNRENKLIFTINRYETDISFTVNEELLKAEITKLVSTDSFEKNILGPIRLNTQSQFGKAPLLRSYKAMKVRLARADSFSSNIDESYFRYNDNIVVNFPGNLIKAFNSEILSSIVENCISFNGGKFKDFKTEQQFVNYIKYWFSPSRCTAFILHDLILENIENFNFSTSTRYRTFIEYIDQNLAYRNIFNEKLLYTAIEKELENAFRSATDYHVLYL